MRMKCEKCGFYQFSSVDVCEWCGEKLPEPIVNKKRYTQFVTKMVYAEEVVIHRHNCCHDYEPDLFASINGF